MAWPIVSLVLLVASVVADCPPGSIYESYFNKCYQFFPTPTSFLDAEQQCNSLGGHLSDVQNAFENAYIAGIASGASSKTPSFWIGANLLRSSTWSWTSKSLFSYTNWALGQPVNSNACGYVKDSDLTWITIACNTQLPFMCTISPNGTVPGFCPTQAPPPTCQPSGCPSDAVCTNGYTLFADSCLCYKYQTSKVSFSDGNATCAADGGMLAKAPTKAINDFLTALPGTNCGGYNCPYIGLTCLSSSVSSCQWADGTPLGNFTNFNGAPKASTFALVTNVDAGDHGMWEANTDTRFFMCQKPPTRASLILERKSEDIQNNEMVLTSQVKHNDN